jgi:hypothetical protein
MRGGTGTVSDTNQPQTFEIQLIPVTGPELRISRSDSHLCPLDQRFNWLSGIYLGS